MGMNDTIIPVRIDASSVDGVTLDVNGADKITIKPEFENDNITTPIAENQIEIIEIQADNSYTPIDHDSLISETFSDADGYNGYVNTGNTTAEFDAGTKLYKVSPGIEEEYTTLTDDAIILGASGGSLFHCSQCFELTKARDINKISIYAGTKTGSAGNVTLEIRTDDTDKPSITVLATKTVTMASITINSWNEFEFPAPVSLSATTKYWIVAYSDQIAGVSPNFSWKGLVAGDYAKGHSAVSADAGTNWNGYLTRDFSFKVHFSITGGVFIENDLPTITGEITHVQLVANCPNREANDGVTFDLIDTDSAEDMGIALNTKHALVNPDGTKITGGKIKINLIPKAISPTEGYPSCKSYAFKLWKS